jgi:CheY-like chemotaxis protein
MVVGKIRTEPCPPFDTFYEQELTFTASRMCSILLVEDHDDTRAVFATLLRMWGHKVSASNSVTGGLAFLNSHKVDVILSDIDLPDRNGYDFIADVRRSNPSVTAIAVSAYNSSADRQRGYDAGFDMHFSKPVDLRGLQSTLMHVPCREMQNGAWTGPEIT